MVLKFGLKDKEFKLLEVMKRQLEEIRTLLEILGIVITVGLFLILLGLYSHGKTEIT